jgi:uncharacterized membrane protein
MMTDEDYRIRKAKGTTLRAFFPIIGLVLVIVFGVIAYTLAPTVTNILYDNGVIQGLSPDILERFDLISGVMIFFVMMLVTGMVYAIAAPKPKKQVTERQLDRERKERIAAEVEAKQRKRKAQAKMAEDRKKSSGR